MRTIALLTLLVVTAPSVGALVCDVVCAAQHEASTTPASGSCHDHGTSQPDSPAVSALHVCHEVGTVQASIVRDSGLHAAVAPAIIGGDVDIAVDPAAGRDIVATQARLTGHAPPSPALPLRI
jgi:hypothetical protein